MMRTKQEALSRAGAIERERKMRERERAGRLRSKAIGLAGDGDFEAFWGVMSSSRSGRERWIDQETLDAALGAALCSRGSALELAQSALALTKMGGKAGLWPWEQAMGSCARSLDMAALWALDEAGAPWSASSQASLEVGRRLAEGAPKARQAARWLAAKSALGASELARLERLDLEQESSAAARQGAARL